MAQKIYLYDSYGYDFYTCEFEGLDANGKPRLTIMTPGCPVGNFLEHLDIMEESPCDYNLLCEADKSAASKLVVEMMAQIYLNANRPFEKMAERLEEMRKWGINYDCDLTRVTVRVSEFENKEPQGSSYYLDLKVGDRYVECVKRLKDLKEIIVKLGEFFFFIENRAQIPLKKYLETSDQLKKIVMRQSSNLFDEVETI